MAGSWGSSWGQSWGSSWGGAGGSSDGCAWGGAWGQSWGTAWCLTVAQQTVAVTACVAPLLRAPVVALPDVVASDLEVPAGLPVEVVVGPILERAGLI